MPEPKPSPAIRLRGVRHNNLKNFDLDLPLHRLIVVTGLSGSGKSSLAFDTLYAEGQRRYIETFSPYARQFFDRMDKPQVDSIEGIPPAIAIEQRNAVRSTRSTVGTMTEICDHMKVLWPYLAQLHCRGCGQPVRKDSPQSVWQILLSSSSSCSSSKKSEMEIEDENEGRGRKESREILVTFNVPLSEKLSLSESLALISKQGYQRLLIKGQIVRLENAEPLLTAHNSPLTVIQDRIKLTPTARARLVEGCEQAYHFGKGKLTIWEIHPPSSILNPRRFSNRLHCAKCDLEYRDPAPALFSFNHPLGACAACKGFGRVITIDYDLAIPDRSLTLAEGAVKPWRTETGAECQRDLTKFCKLRRVPMNVPFSELSNAHQRWVMDGDEDYGMDDEHRWPRLWYGVKGYFRWLETKSYKMHVRVLLSRYRAYTKCPTCDGARLKPDALLYFLPVGDDARSLKSNLATGWQEKKKLETPHVASCKRLTLPDFYALPVRDALALIESLAKHRTQDSRLKTQDPIRHALNEVRARLAYLDEVGLGYLTLDRPTRTLSGGETERVNLTTCLGTRLVNTLFVLDEPSVGLHSRDTDRLIRILEKLRDTGNTVIVVEHEASVMRAADQIVDIGPGHGATGGEVIFQGPLRELLKSTRSLTGQYLSGRKQVEIPQRRPVTLECGDLSPLSPLGDLSPDKGAQSARRMAPAPAKHGEPPERGSALLTSQQSAKSGDKSPHSKTAPKLALRNATRHNLNNVSVEIPLQRFVAITGVSGSGKSTLIRDILLPALQAKLQSAIGHPPSAIPKASDRLGSDTDKNTEADETSNLHSPSAILSGFETLAQVVLVDQSALGKTPRSNPAVYIGAFDDIREVFAQSEAARQRGLNASAFSFNSGAGQCERCRGAGFEKIEMQFLSDIFIRCPDCNGRRYRQHILEVKISRRRREESHSKTESSQRLVAASPVNDEWSIGDMLDATVDEAIDFLAGFADSKPAARATAGLKLLQEVGLGYLRLGQPINTLSGGESQRLKLVRHLAEFGVPASAGSSEERPPEGGTPNHTLFLFDEPTTGLHFDDVRVLLQVFQRLVTAGHSVVVIEHNLDVIKCADWVIDLGPEAGDGGGRIVAQGTPEHIAACKTSHTGQALKTVLTKPTN